MSEKVQALGRRWKALTKSSLQAVADSGAVFARDVGQGMLEVGHNSLAFVGFVIVAVVLFTAGRAELRQSVEGELRSWLQARHEARQVATTPAEAVPDLGEPDAIARATAIDPSELTKAQAAIARGITRKYKVAPEPVGRLVQEAWRVGEMTKLDPLLILAVMAVESSFNPFAQSPVGAQGLMQVMTKVHDDKYQSFGGRHAAFDPVTNLRVGVLVLKECIARAGSIEAGLRYYVGAANLGDDGGYAVKVIAEQNQLRALVGMKPLPLPARRAPADAADRPAPEGTEAPADDPPPAAEKVALAD